MWKFHRAVLVVIVLISGCAVGVKHDYMVDSLDLEVETDKSIAVGTLDHRDYVLDSRKNSNFVGLSRGGFGNPFDVVTLSGHPLAEDISYSIASSLRKNDVDIKVVELSPSQSVDAAAEKLHAEAAQRSLLLTLFEWKGDTYFNVGFTYNFDVRIFNREGNLLFEKHLQGNDNLGAAAAFSPGGAEKIGPRFKALMESLFADPEVKQYLN
jgi:hypothetical protein